MFLNRPVTCLLIILLSVLATFSCGVQSEVLKYYWHNEVTGESTWDYPEWKYYSEEHKRHYYIDPETKETTWDMPVEYSWEELKDADGTGNIYYHNKKTGETSWEKPAQFGWTRHVHKEEL